MGQFTTMAAEKSTNFIITKYVLLLLIVANIGSTVWVGIYNKRAVDKAGERYPADRWTGDKGLGESAKVWHKLCITFLVFENLFNLMGVFAAIQENYCVSIIYSITMFGAALYGAAAKYMRPSVCSYLNPFVVAVVAAVFSHMIRSQNYRFDEEKLTQNSPQTKPLVAPKPSSVVIASRPSASPYPSSSPQSSQQSSSKQSSRAPSQSSSSQSPQSPPKPSSRHSSKPNSTPRSTKSSSSSPKANSVNGNVTEV